MSSEVKEKPRERVLSTAAELFYRNGLSSVSIDRLCDVAQVSKRSLYQYFGSRDEIISAMLAERGPGLVNLYLGEDENGSPRDRILAVFDQLQANSTTEGFSGCPFVNVASDLRNLNHPAMNLAREFKLRLTGFFERQLVLARVNDAADYAIGLTMLFDGANAHAIMNGSVPDAAVASVAALLDSIGVR